MTKTITLTNLRHNLDDHLQQVARGDELLITRYGRLIARIVQTDLPEKAQEESEGEGQNIAS